MSSETYPTGYRTLKSRGLFGGKADVGGAGILRRISAHRHVETWLVITGALLAGALYAWFAGEDINWDWRNYHDYGAFALINGRFDQDVAPGGFQTFLNPLPYLPAYLLRHVVGAPFWGMWLGALHGLNLALIWWCSRLILGNAASRPLLMASVVIAAFGPMTLSEVGTSFADILTALPVIAGVGLLLSAEERNRWRYAIAGVLVGAAVGLKLTNMVFAIGAGLSLLYAPKPIKAIGCFAIGGFIGTLASGGVWSWTLWREFGNPLFPFYNGFFRSPEAPLESIADLRFMPHGAWEAFAYPFYWAVGIYKSSEWPFRDPRFAVVFVMIALCVGAGVLSRRTIFNRRDKQFILFFLGAYLVWLLEFSIHRYAVTLELLCAPMIVLLLVRFSSAWHRDAIDDGAWVNASSRAWLNWIAVGLAIVIAAWSQPADWSRRPWSDAYQPRIPAELSKPATYLMIEKPLGYVVPYLGKDSRAYQLSDILMPIVPGGSLDRRIRDGLAHPLPGGVWAIHLHGSAPRQCLLDAYDLEIDSTRACAIIPGADSKDIEACPLRPSEKPQTHANACEIGDE